MANRSLNKVQLIGNLTRDPELRYTPQGTAVCTFGLATNRTWVTDTGEKREETEFHRIVAWSKLAELCAQYLFKGRKVFVEGRLRTRQWTSQDGSSRQTTEVVISDMIILDSKRSPEETADEVVPDEPELGDASAGKGKVKPAGEGDFKAKKGTAAADDQTQADDGKTSKGGKGTKKKEDEEVDAGDIPF